MTGSAPPPANEKAGQHELAIAAFNQSPTLNAGQAMVLNDRCWAKAMLGKDLDGARADCAAALNDKLAADYAGYGIAP